MSWLRLHHVAARGVAYQPQDGSEARSIGFVSDAVRQLDATPEGVVFGIPTLMAQWLLSVRSTTWSPKM